MLPTVIKSIKYATQNLYWKTATKYFLANEICQSCHKSSEDMPQPVSKCIKSSTRKSNNKPEIYHKIMLYPITKNLPKKLLKLRKYATNK